MRRGDGLLRSPLRDEHRNQFANELPACCIHSFLVVHASRLLSTLSRLARRMHHKKKRVTNLK